MGDEEELLEPGRPPLSRRKRLGALLLAVLTVSTLIAIRAWPRSTHPSAAVPPATTAGSVVLPAPAPAPETTSRPWPTTAGACGSDAELPIVSSTPLNEHTGIRVLLGGGLLRTVDFDTGRVTAMPRAGLRPGEFVDDLEVASQPYAATTTCNFPPPRVLRVGAGTSVVTLPGSVDRVLSDGTHAWAVTSPKEHKPRGLLIPLDGGHQVRLPANFYPEASASGVIVGVLETLSAGPESVMLVDATTGSVRANLGKGWPIAAGNGLVLLAKGCDAASDTPCTLSRISVTGGAAASYRLPRPVYEGVVSPDRRLIALTLERPTLDARFEGHPIPPNDIAILHLDTGRLEIVPGIEVPAKTSPGLAFAADSRWLVIALSAGSKTRLLAWRSGLTHPYESKPIAGQTLQRPPILVLPARADR